MLVSMAKVQIIGLRPDLEPVLATLHRVGVLELTPLAPPHPLEMPSVRPAVPDREQVARVQAVVDQLGALLALLPSSVSPTAELLTHAAGQATAEALAAATDLLAPLDPVGRHYTSRRAALESELASLRRYRDIMERLLPLVNVLVELEGFETVALLIQPTYRFVVDTLRDELTALTLGQCELVAAEAPDGSIVALLVFSRRFATDVYGLLHGEQLTEVRLPPEYHGRPLRDTIDELDRREQQIPAELAALQRETEDALLPHLPELALWRAVLLDRLDELQIVGQCVETDYTFALAGWVPERDLPALEQALAQRFDQRVAVERLPVRQADWAEMPVLLENPRLLRPFEVLLRLQPAPRYGSIDPTPFVAFFFPFFFGLIVGDIGYGLLLLALALWVIRRRAGPPWIRQAAQVLAMSAVVAIAFGVAFGEFFGNLGHSFGLRPLLVDRMQAIQPLLLFSVAVGAVQVALGLVLGIINSYLERQGKEALSRAGTLAGLVAVFVLVGVAVERLPGGALTPGMALLAIAIVLLVYSVGVAGPLEIFGVMGNILSYTRLVAVGLASVILAQVANDLAGHTGSILLGFVVGALFHGLNLALGLFSPTVHSLRLQYVEFFGRFFQPGGRPYAPFRCHLGRPDEERGAA